MKFFLSWGCLLIIALAAPIALPAGGGTIRNELEINYGKEPMLCFAGESCFIFSSPYLSSSKLCRINLGSPLNVIRIWENEKGQKWIQVKQNYYGDHFSFFPSQPKRGWINV